MPEVSFGRPPVLTLEFTRRQFPGGDNELLPFRDLLDKSYPKLRTDWHHEFLGSGLEFRVNGDGLGHFSMVCDLDDQGGLGSQLTFEIGFDQTEIPEMLAALNEVLSVFPTIREAGDS